MSTFLLMNSSGKLHRQNCADVWYETERGAKAAATRLTKKTGVEWKAISYEEFEMNHNPLVEVKNCLTGKSCMIRKNDLGTILDPSQEKYFSF